MGPDHDLVKKHLIGHRKSRMEWDEYRDKHIDPETQEILKEIFRECRVNGFFNPHVVKDQVVFAQMIKSVIKYKDKAFYKKYKWPLTVAEMRAKSEVYE